MRIILFLLLTAQFFLLPGIHAQDPFNFKFQTYTTTNGLVHNYTKKCQQDSKGFLWIVTQHGISRFDGINFKNFEHSYADSNSLPQNDVEDIAIDKDDNIWLSYKTGLCFYSQVTHRFKKISSNGHPLESYVITFDKKRNCIWSVNFAAYSSINCSSLSVQSTPFTTIEDHNNGEINFLLLDSKDRLWIPYARARYHCIELASSRQYFHNERLQPTSFYEDDEKNIWMTAWHKGFRKVILNDTLHQFEKYGDPNLRISETPYEYISQGVTQSEALGGKNILWVVKYDDGVFLFDKAAGKFVKQFYYNSNNKNGIATDFNEYIFTDKDDNIWICTWYGITKVNKLEQQFISRELPELKDQLNNWVSGLLDDPYQKNTLWMSVCGMGLVKYEKASGRILHRYGFYYDDNRAILSGPDYNYDWRWTTDLWQDSSKQLWSTTYAGLFKITNGTVTKLELKNKEGNFIYPKLSKEFAKGIVWVVGRAGIFKVNAVTNDYSFYQDEKDKAANFYDIEQLDNNNLLLAGDSGIKTFNIPTGTFTRLIEKNIVLSTAEMATRCIEIIDQQLYIGSLGGLRRYDISTKITAVIGFNEGIDKVDECRLKKDVNKNLWVITSHGMFKYSPLKNTFEKYTTSDGIYSLSEDAATFFSYNNQFHIGYRMAITSFDPLQVNVNSVKVNPVISEVLINGKTFEAPIDSFQQLSAIFSHRQNEITFNYTAPDFTNTDKISFMYQLQGYDTGWILAGSRRAVTYNNLLPGNYTFRLKAANSSNLWNEKIAVFRFDIRPAFWQTIWFRLLIIIMAAAIVYLFYRYRLKQVQKFYEVRSSISRNLHDEIGATLSSINIYSDVARNKVSEIESKKLLDKMYDASAKAMESMSDIVWYVNPQNDMLENMLVRMREYALPLLEAKNINVLFEADQKVETVKLDMQQRQHLYLIFKEAINNVLKYAAAANISIILTKEINTIKMQIKDDGKGFDAAIVSGGNGLMNMQYRATALNGNIRIESVAGKGTTVSLVFTIT